MAAPEIPDDVRKVLHRMLDALLDSIRVCDGCGRAFVDRSRNHSRRWCAMQRCGNQEKVRAYRRRARSP